MAVRFRTRIARAVNDALLERDRAEMRAVDTVLSLVEPPRRRRPVAKRRPTTRRKRR